MFWLNTKCHYQGESGKVWTNTTIYSYALLRMMSLEVKGWQWLLLPSCIIIAAVQHPVSILVENFQGLAILTNLWLPNAVYSQQCITLINKCLFILLHLCLDDDWSIQLRHQQILSYMNFLFLYAQATESRSVQYSPFTPEKQANNVFCIGNL